MRKTCEACGRQYEPNPKQSYIRRAGQRFCSTACRLSRARPPVATRWTKADGAHPPPTRSVWPCRSQPGGCRCHCHALIKGKAESKAVHRDAWLPMHDAMICEMVAQGVAPVDIAAALSKRFSVPRKEQAVRRRIVRLGISTRDGWWSRWETSQLLGVSRETLARLEEGGAIEAQPFASWRRYREDDIKALIRQQAGVTIDPRRVRNAAWRSLAEVSATVNARAM